MEKMDVSGTWMWLGVWKKASAENMISNGSADMIQSSGNDINDTIAFTEE